MEEGSSANGQQPPPEIVDGEEDQQLRRQIRLQPGAEERLVLQFMDSVDSYLSLFDALSSTLRQGWFDLASARHSMGVSRINTTLLDLKFHSASTTLKITKNDGTQPCFTLHKWVSSEQESTELEDENVQPQDSHSVKSPDNDEVQKERSKYLSTFGILISPKLRATQLSFERALETIVEIANMQSSMLYSFHQLHQDDKDAKE